MDVSALSRYGRRDSLGERGARPIEPRSDEQLVRRANDGDEAAFEAIYARYAAWVLSRARRYSASDDDAHDVLQETFSYLLGKFPGFELNARFTTFLFPVVRHIAIRVRERTRRQQGDPLADAGILQNLPATPERPSPGTARGELSAVLNALAPIHREVVLLRFVDDLSMEEIAGTLSIPVGTVKSRLHKALHRLRDDPRIRIHFGNEPPSPPDA